MRATLITLLLIATTATARANPTQELDQGRISFRKEDWQSAFKTINALLYPEVRLGRREEAIEAYLLLGAALFHAGNRERAQKEFTNALQLDPDQSITTNMYSEGAVRLFEDTKRDFKDRLEKEAARKREAERLAAIEAYKKSLVVYEQNPYYVNFVPFGAGQIQNRHYVKGVVLGTSQLLTGGASLGIWIYLARKYGIESNSVPFEDGPTVRLLQQVEIGAGIAFIGLYAYSVFDSLRHYKPHRQVKGDDSLLPEDLKNLEQPTKPKPKKTSLRDRLHFGPMLMPDGIGIGLTLEND